MSHQDLLDRYMDAWNRKAVADVLKLMDPQASYHDAFWGETCSGSDLVRYFDISFSADTRWYEQDGELISTPTGFIFQYLAFDRQNPGKRKLLYRGAEVVTLEDGIITGISDFYCDPDPVQLLEVATYIEKRRSKSDVAQLGMSAKTAGYIKRRLAELGENTSAFLDPSLSVRQLADRVGCTVSHLHKVLEEGENTSFGQFLNDYRVRYAASILAEGSGDTINIGLIASNSGFRQIDEFEESFQTTFGMSAEQYSVQALQQRDCQRVDDSKETA